MELACHSLYDGRSRHASNLKRTAHYEMVWVFLGSPLLVHVGPYDTSIIHDPPRYGICSNIPSSQSGWAVFRGVGIDWNGHDCLCIAPSCTVPTVSRFFIGHIVLLRIEGILLLVSYFSSPLSIFILFFFVNACYVIFQPPYVAVCATCWTRKPQNLT